MDSTEALIDRARAPDASLAMRQAAFSLIVERYQDAAYGYALATLGDPHLAWDAAQEAFLTAYCSLAQLRSPGAPFSNPCVAALLAGAEVAPPRVAWASRLVSREPELWTPAARQFVDWLRHIAADTLIAPNHPATPRVDGQ